MHYEAMRLYLEIAQLFFTAAAIVFAWWRTREKVASHRFAAIDKKLTEIESDIKLFGGVEKRVGKIEEDVKSHANCQYHQGFEARLDNMNGAINKLEGTVAGRLEGIGSSLDLIQQHLLSGGK